MTSQASRLPLAEWRRLFSTDSRLSRSVCRSGCIRTEEWKKTEKDRLKLKGRSKRSKRNAHIHGVSEDKMTNT